MSENSYWVEDLTVTWKVSYMSSEQINWQKQFSQNKQ